jgi:hypothetical protein
MTTKFNWSITSMPAYPQEAGQADVVFQVNWRCEAIDAEPEMAGSFVEIAIGSVPVTYAAGAPYTPYNQLTQNQVWGWINPEINRPAIEADLQAQIDAQKNPPVVTPPLPWSN